LVVKVLPLGSARKGARASTFADGATGASDDPVLPAVWGAGVPALRVAGDLAMQILKMVS